MSATRHDFFTTATHGCDESHHCPVCDGGLAECRACRAFEGGLPTDCPGVPIPGDDQHAIYEGKLDFVAGAWVRKEVNS